MAFQNEAKGATDTQEFKDSQVYRQALKEITTEISSATNLDSMLLDLTERILDFF